MEEEKRREDRGRMDKKYDLMFRVGTGKQGREGGGGKVGSEEGSIVSVKKTNCILLKYECRYTFYTHTIASYLVTFATQHVKQTDPCLL